MSGRQTIPESMMKLQAMNSRNKWVPRHARPAAGAAFCPVGAGEQSVFEPKSAPASSGVATGSREQNASKTRSVRTGGLVLAKPDAARYQVQAFSAALLEAPAWSAAIAQLVEHVIRNDGVTGSNPVCGTKT